MEQEEKSCDKVETMLAYLGDRVSAGGGCKAAVTARTRYGRVIYSECGESLHGMRFHPKQKGAVFRSYIRPAIVYGRERWWLAEGEIGILQWTEIQHCVE